jgi:hypothetical protein
VISTGTGALPVMNEVKREAKRRKIKLVVLRTTEAIEKLKHESAQTSSQVATLSVGKPHQNHHPSP